MSNLASCRARISRATRDESFRVISIAAPLAAFAIIAVTEGPRTALLVALAAGAILATRVRFCGYIAALLVLGFTVIAQFGHGING